jgi:hypothetical protein
MLQKIKTVCARKLFVLSPFWLTSAHVVLQLLDWATTLFLVLLFGTGMEANPIMKTVLDYEYGVELFTALKLLLTASLTVVIPWSLKISPGYAWVWRALMIAYVFIVTNNLIGVTIFCMQP